MTVRWSAAEERRRWLERLRRALRKPGTAPVGIFVDGEPGADPVYVGHTAKSVLRKIEDNE